MALMNNVRTQDSRMLFNIHTFGMENRQQKMAISAAATYTLISVMPVFRSVIEEGISIEQRVQAE